MWSGEPNIVHCGTIIQLCTGDRETSASRQTTIGSYRHNPRALWKAVPITCLLLFHFQTWRIISAASSTNLIPSATCHLVLCPRTDSLNFNLWLLPYSPCYYYLRVLYFANFCDLQKIAKLSTRKNFYQPSRHSGECTCTIANCMMFSTLEHA